MRKACVGVALLSVMAASGVLAQPSGTWGEPFSTTWDGAYLCVRAMQPIVLDGKLDDPAWGRATVIEHLVVPPYMDSVAGAMTKPTRALSTTRVRLAWDEEYLYVGGELADQDLYCETPEGHDAPFGTDDILELFVKPSDALPYYWELHVVPSGGTRDYFYARRSAGGNQRWIPYDSGMAARVTLQGTLDDWTDRDTGWTAEMRIPWSAFAQMGGQPRVGTRWRFLVSRYDYSVHLPEGCELSAAAPLPLQSYHLYEYYPYLRFVP
jgi:hypothetical protein